MAPGKVFLEPTRFFLEFGLAPGLLERSNTGVDPSKNLKSWISTF